MKRTKLVGALAALATASVVLAGCGSTNGGNSSSSGGDENNNAKSYTLTIASNAISGGKNAQEADWITNWVIPHFEKAQKKKDIDATVKFSGSGVDDEKYKTKMSLDLKSGGGPDIIALDGIWFGEFAQAGYIKPLNDVVGKDTVEAWDGWKQITPAVQKLASYKDERYGIPDGTDGRFIYFNKKLFKKAGLPDDWQPKSWDDILSAAEALKKLDGVTPMQLNAGNAMGEATTMQGVLPMLVGTGHNIWEDGKWQGDTKGFDDVMKFYDTVYNSKKLGDSQLQLETNGRDKSFKEFSEGKIGMLFESDYVWRSVINPDEGIDPMSDRDDVVGWAKIPAMKPGTGINGQDFVSMSGGSGTTINPKTKYPKQAFELLTFMKSKEALEARYKDTPHISARDDVNSEILKGNPLLSFVAKDVLPITAYRPGLPEYTEVSQALQQASESIVSGKSVDSVGKAYQSKLSEIVGGSDNVFD